MESRKTDSLTYERAVEILRYDSQNGVLERKLKNGEWRVCGHKPTNNGYGRLEVDGKNYKTHRLIWLLTYGDWPECIDHIDHDKLNNRIINLRSVTKVENEHNRGMNKNNSSGFPGVYFDKLRNKYKAQIRVNGNHIHIGYYSTAEEAFLAYQLAKIKYHPSSPDAQQYLRELTMVG